MVICRLPLGVSGCHTSPFLRWSLTPFTTKPANRPVSCALLLQHNLFLLQFPILWWIIDREYWPAQKRWNYVLLHNLCLGKHHRPPPHARNGFIWESFHKCGWVGWLIPKQGPNPPQITPKIAFFDPNFTFCFPKSQKNLGWVVG